MQQREDEKISNSEKFFVHLKLNFATWNGTVRVETHDCTICWASPNDLIRSAHSVDLQISLRSICDKTEYTIICMIESTRINLISKFSFYTYKRRYNKLNRFCILISHSKWNANKDTINWIKSTCRSDKLYELYSVCNKKQKEPPKMQRFIAIKNNWQFFVLKKQKKWVFVTKNRRNHLRYNDLSL